MNELFEKLYKGEVEAIEVYGLPKNEIFRKKYKEWQARLAEDETKFLERIGDGYETEYLSVVGDRAMMELLEINAMFVEGVKVGLNLKGRKGRIKAVKKIK